MTAHPLGQLGRILLLFGHRRGLLEGLRLSVWVKVIRPAQGLALYRICCVKGVLPGLAAEPPMPETRIHVQQKCSSVFARNFAIQSGNDSC